LTLKEAISVENANFPVKLVAYIQIETPLTNCNMKFGRKQRRQLDGPIMAWNCSPSCINSVCDRVCNKPSRRSSPMQCVAEITPGL
jgi:hypothetical protein